MSFFPLVLKYAIKTRKSSGGGSKVVTHIAYAGDSYKGEQLPNQLKHPLKGEYCPLGGLVLASPTGKHEKYQEPPWHEC